MHICNHSITSWTYLYSPVLSWSHLFIFVDSLNIENLNEYWKFCMGENKWVCEANSFINITYTLSQTTASVVSISFYHFKLGRIEFLKRFLKWLKNPSAIRITRHKVKYTGLHTKVECLNTYTLILSFDSWEIGLKRHKVFNFYLTNSWISAHVFKFVLAIKHFFDALNNGL